MLATSSGDTNGASMSGAYPLTSTIGIPLALSRLYRERSARESACSPDTKTIPSTLCRRSTSTYSASVVPPGDCVHSSGVNPRADSSVSISCAKAGKTGLVSSGTISPISPIGAAVRLVGRS